MSLLTSTLNDAGLALGLPTLYEPWGANGTMSTWPGANLALFLPLAPFPAPFRTTGVKVGINDAGGGNIDVAIVTVSGGTATRLASSGSTAASEAYVPETIAFTAALTIPPGRQNYYLGIALASGTAEIMANEFLAYDDAGFGVAQGQLQKASSFPIAASTASLVDTTATFFPWFQLIRG